SRDKKVLVSSAQDDVHPGAPLFGNPRAVHNKDAQNQNESREDKHRGDQSPGAPVQLSGDDRQYPSESQHNGKGTDTEQQHEVKTVERSAQGQGRGEGDEGKTAVKQSVKRPQDVNGCR